LAGLATLAEIAIGQRLRDAPSRRPAAMPHWPSAKRVLSFS